MELGNYLYIYINILVLVLATKQLTYNVDESLLLLLLLVVLFCRPRLMSGERPKNQRPESRQRIDVKISELQQQRQCRYTLTLPIGD